MRIHRTSKQIRIHHTSKQIQAVAGANTDSDGGGGERCGGRFGNWKPDFIFAPGSYRPR
jgi:hypothetical protein